MKNKDVICKQILTIPNLLTTFRLILIPIFVLFYTMRDYYTTAIIFTVSGITDIADGFIARHFNMISDFGKAFDPIVDKLTQAAMMVCVATREPLMWILFGILFIKEFTTGITSLWVVKKTGEVNGARWYGKLTTCLIFVVMVIHLVFPDIKTVDSHWLITLCLATMLFSFMMYISKNIMLLSKRTPKKEQ